eukprot:TRINITY_DN9975_c0_g1_i1.p2 TRINITY_DN9975_c0_g1~~TRINITY_DN9975_c0_g1_i1.p2  ORF type:complete len:214 (+),score=79.76 TRINITY_DN9975_c0_g1_i1:115-756(+)
MENPHAWERKKVEVRRLETEIETHLIQLENLGPGVSPQEVKALHDEAVRLVAQLRQSAQMMKDWAEEATGVQANMMRNQAEQCEDVVAEKQRAIRQIAQSINTKRARHELLATVQADISEYTESHRTLNAESDGINKATAAAEQLLMQATSGHEQMKTQHNAFVRAQDRAAQIVGMVPGIDGILKKIRNKRQRDTLVLGTLIAVCLFLIYVFW